MTDEKYKLADDVREIAERICKKSVSFEYIHLNKMAFVRKNGNSKSTIATCSGLHGKLACITDKKYIITVIGDRFDHLSEEIKEKVIEHELMHISCEFDGSMIDHDVKDFSRILIKYGLNWQNVAEDGTTSFPIPVNAEGKFEENNA